MWAFGLEHVGGVTLTTHISKETIYLRGPDMPHNNNNNNNILLYTRIAAYI
jgi:hypothetical protein